MGGKAVGWNKTRLLRVVLCLIPVFNSASASVYWSSFMLQQVEVQCFPKGAGHRIFEVELNSSDC